MYRKHGIYTRKIVYNNVYTVSKKTQNEKKSKSNSFFQFWCVSLNLPEAVKVHFINSSRYYKTQCKWCIIVVRYWQTWEITKKGKKRIIIYKKRKEPKKELSDKSNIIEHVTLEKWNW